MKVVTWQTPRGDRIRICNICALRLQRERHWPRVMVPSFQREFRNAPQAIQPSETVQRRP